MKIALVTETYPPEVNGVAMTLRRLVAGLAARGHALEVIRPRQADEEVSASSPPFKMTGGDAREWLVPGAPLPFYKTLRMGLPVQGALLRRWQAQRPDVVHIATEGPLGLAALQAARKLRLPVTSTFHTNFHRYGGHYGLRLGRDIALRYLRWFHNQTLCTLAPTDEACRQLADEGFQRLRTLARGVDATLFSPRKRLPSLRERWGAAPDDPVILYVGRIAAEKNLGLAVQAVLAMREIEPRAKFVLVGDGPERAALAREHPQFFYAGMQRGEELAAHYASADAFVFASTTETFGNVITEAMASGLVTVAYDYAAARQHMLHGVNGFVARFDEPSHFLATARAAMMARRDWPVIATGARRTAEAITWEAVICRFEAELEAASLGAAHPV